MGTNQPLKHNDPIIHAAVPRPLLNELDAFAHYKGVSRSDVIRWALREYLAREKV